MILPKAATAILPASASCCPGNSTFTVLYPDLPSTWQLLLFLLSLLLLTFIQHFAISPYFLSHLWEVSKIIFHYMRSLRLRENK